LALARSLSPSLSLSPSHSLSLQLSAERAASPQTFRGSLTYPHGGLRTFHQKSTCLEAVNLKDFLEQYGHVTP
ncbi:hypothetical protein T484DRAFT_1921907, partial [Baffinella frigidus]